MTEEFNEYRMLESIQREIWQRLHALPNVIGSAIGYKVVAGHETQLICLVIFVSEKQNLSDDHPSMVFLQELNNRDILTDVVVMNKPTDPIPLILMDDPRLAKGRTDEINPMIGGISCGPAVSILKFPYSGTLGISVSRTDMDTLGILSNYHVMYYDKSVSDVDQPARVNSISNHLAATNISAYMGNVPLDGLDTFVDCAVASKVAKRMASRGVLYDVDETVIGYKKRSELKINNKVFKSGLTTGVTSGLIKYISLSGPEGIQPNQIAILGDNGKPFAAEGDSGSVVVSGNKAIGLLWGGNTLDNKYYGVVSPIEAVINTLKIEF